MRTYRKTLTGNSLVDRNLSDIQDALYPLVSNGLLNGIEVKNIAISGDTVVNHGLGRAVVSYIITDINANANVWRVAATSNSITLTASGPVTVSLWIY